MKTPVALFIYKRPQLARQALAAIRQAAPQKLFVIADGPKIEADQAAVTQTRQLIAEIDWRCQVKTNLAPTNMGLRRRVVSGLNWVFDQVDRAIILEDDCIADQSFFDYCELLLSRYQKDTKIISLAGNNFQFGKTRINASYYFSRYIHSWGWATWSRAWQLYDDAMTSWPQLKHDPSFARWLGSDMAAHYWSRVFDLVTAEKIDSWAYRWSLTSFTHQKLTTIPARNIVTNIGYGNMATNTRIMNKAQKLTLNTLSLPLKHPQTIRQNKAADEVTERHIYSTPKNRLVIKAKALLGI